jgi:hypothetical protein
MNALKLLSILIFINTQVFAQEIPKIRFNHLYFVVDTKDLSAIKKSNFIKNRLAAIEIRTTNANDSDSWTGTYLYGTENYFELFDSVGFLPKGSSGIGFSVDNTGELDSLKECLDKKYTTELFERVRDAEGHKIPWFDELTIDDSTSNSLSRFGFWIMEYKKEYFDYKKYSYKNNALTREDYLKGKEADRKNKILKRFSGVVLKLSVDEKKFLITYFKNINYRMVNENEYLSPDNFRFLIKDRALNDNNTIESLEFETTKKTGPKTIKVSANVSIIIDGKRGLFVFEQ